MRGFTALIISAGSCALPQKQNKQTGKEWSLCLNFLLTHWVPGRAVRAESPSYPMSLCVKGNADVVKVWGSPCACAPLAAEARAWPWMASDGDLCYSPRQRGVCPDPRVACGLCATDVSSNNSDWKTGVGVSWCLWEQLENTSRN